MALIEAIRNARNLGADYLLGHLGEDGAFPSRTPAVAEYYKTLTAFQVCGHNRAANRLCNWIRHHGQLENGDFIPRPEAGSDGSTYIYFNAWIVTGAHRLGQFDLARRGMDFILDFNDSESGGFYSSLTDRQPDTLQDLMASCMSGLAAIYTGEIAVARGVGRWLGTVRDAQPDFPGLLYTVYSRAGSLITDVPSGQENRYVLNRDADQDQDFFNPGIAAAFLCRLYQATGDGSYLNLAKQYMAVAEDASDYLFRIVRAGKVGWAAALLYRLTGDGTYYKMAVRIARNLLDLQSPEGFWSGVGQTAPSLDSTAERVVWMDEILQAVE